MSAIMLRGASLLGETAAERAAYSTQSSTGDCACLILLFSIGICRSDSTGLLTIGQ